MKKNKICFMFLTFIVILLIINIISIDKKIGESLGCVFFEIESTAVVLQKTETNEERDLCIEKLQKKLIHYHMEIRDYTLNFPYRGYYIQELGFFLQDVRSEKTSEEVADIIIGMADYIEKTGIKDITSKQYYMYMIDPMGARAKLELIINKYDSNTHLSINME